MKMSKKRLLSSIIAFAIIFTYSIPAFADVAAGKYKVTVTGGEMVKIDNTNVQVSEKEEKDNIDATNDVVIEIKAAEVTGKKFKAWDVKAEPKPQEGKEVKIDDKTKSSATVTLTKLTQPDTTATHQVLGDDGIAVTIDAIFTSTVTTLPDSNVTLVNSEGNIPATPKTAFDMGETVYVKAPVKSGEQVFEKWIATKPDDNAFIEPIKFTSKTVDGNELGSFTMPNEPVKISAKYEDAYAVTVEGGKLVDADGEGTDIKSYAENATVHIKATPAAGKVFKEWVTTCKEASHSDHTHKCITAVDGKDFVATTETTSFKMPAYAVTVKAEYTDGFQVTVVNGTIGSADSKITEKNFKPSETVKIFPGEKTGEVFDKWDYNNIQGMGVSIDGDGKVDLTLPGTVSVDANAITFTATYTADKNYKYEVNVVNGEIVEDDKVASASADGLYKVGDEIAIVAEDKLGKTFKEWSVSDEDSSLISYKKDGLLEAELKIKIEGLEELPEEPVTITITAEYYQDLNHEYDVTVEGGTADVEKAKFGATVTVTADEAPEGKVFDKWTTENEIDLVAETAEVTTFVMTGENVTVTAEFVDEEDPENPDPENPDPENPDPENPDPENPDPENPDPENPDPENPDPENPENPKDDDKNTGKGSSSSGKSGGGSNRSSGSSRELDGARSTSSTSSSSSVSTSAVSNVPSWTSSNLTSNTSSAGSYGVRQSAFASLQGQSFTHDTVEGGAVQMRMQIGNPSLINKDVLVSGSVKGAAVEETKAKFNKWFANELQVLHMDQTGSWGQEVKIAAKIDLSKMNVNNLTFYSFDKATGKYYIIEKPNYSIDSNGYLHFSTELAGDIIISEGALQVK